MEMLNRAGYAVFLVDDANGEDGENVQRRRFLVDVGAVAGISNLRAAVALGDSDGDLRTAEQVTAAAQHYVRLERELGGGVAYGPAVRIAQQLIRRAKSERVGAAYIRAVGWYTHETAWLAYDSGARQATRHYASHALNCAREAGDRLLQARAYNLLSLVAASVRDGQSAAEFARRGVAAAREAGTERTLLWARLARAVAVQGRERESFAMQALDRAREAADSPRDIYEAVANRGIVLEGLGRLAKASEPLTEAADIIGDLGEPRNRCLYIARLAKVAVRQNEPVKAAALVTQVLDEAEKIVSTRVDSHLSGWMALTAPRCIAAIPEVRAARERVNERVPSTTRI